MNPQDKDKKAKKVKVNKVILDQKILQKEKQVADKKIIKK